MSVVDQFRNLFSRKSAESSLESSGELSLAMPASLDSMVSRSMKMAGNKAGNKAGNRAAAMASPDLDTLAQDDSGAPLDTLQQAEVIAVPLLGRRSIVAHQRILFTAMALALAVLFLVAIFAVRQADTVAQQVAGTG